jgi:hypothetical protein
MQDKKWRPIEREWNNVQVNFTLDLIDIASSSSSPTKEDFLPSPLYHFLSELLRDNHLPPLQVGLIKSALLSLRYFRSLYSSYFLLLIYIYFIIIIF